MIKARTHSIMAEMMDQSFISGIEELSDKEVTA